MGELDEDWIEDQERISAAETSGIGIDVVAISRGFDFPDPQPIETETWTFYNILWVYWKDGVAYRKGVGRVKRKAWEALERKDVFLILG